MLCSLFSNLLYMALLFSVFRKLDTKDKNFDFCEIFAPYNVVWGIWILFSQNDYQYLNLDDNKCSN